MEQNNIQKKEEISFFSLFRFSTRKDKCLMIIGGVAAYINGFAMPLFSIVFGEMIGILFHLWTIIYIYNKKDAFDPETPKQVIVDQAVKQALWFVLIGFGTLLCSLVQMATWIKTGETQAIRYRQEYFKHLLKQDIQWYDQTNPSVLTQQVTSETFKVQNAIGEKVVTFVMTISMFINGFIVAFCKGWELALICLASLPAVTITSYFYIRQIQTSQLKVQESYDKAGVLVEQVVTGIKTIKSLNGQNHELSKYEKLLQQARKISIKYSIYIGTALGLIWFVLVANYSLGFYFGSLFIGNKTNNDLFNRPYTTGDVLAVFLSIMMGNFSLGQAVPCLSDFSQGKIAAKKIFGIIDSKPVINQSLQEGIKLQKEEQLQKGIEFKDVSYSYASQKDKWVFQNLNLNFLAGKKTAIVGKSGGGKSTIMQLLERYYDIDSGQILIESIDIKTLNLASLRDRIGYVGQEPILFNTTIRENMLFGDKNATEEQIWTALEKANAKDFIKNLSEGLETQVGNMGQQLSGGQKQRISIARALLKNPCILLFDEATSALDRENEEQIQATLDKISQNITTVIVAHKLQTIKNSDHIYVLDEGKVVEQGTHGELIDQNKVYKDLWDLQLLQKQKDQQKEKELDIFKKENEFEKQNEQQLTETQNTQVELVNQIQQPEKKSKKSKSQKNQKNQNKSQIWLRIFKKNKPEIKQMVLGSFFSAIGGAVIPFWGFVMVKMIGVLIQVNIKDKNDFREEADFWCLMFLLVGFALCISTIMQFSMWNFVSQGLTKRLRFETFQKIINMRVPWFEQKENTVGAINQYLGRDGQLVNGLTSTAINYRIQNIFTFVSCMFLALYHEWRIGLIGFLAFPIMYSLGVMQAKYMQGFSEQTDIEYKQANDIISESVNNIRTILAFNLDKKVLQMFDTKLDVQKKILNLKSLRVASFFAYQQCILFWIYAALFYSGSQFYKKYDSDPIDIFAAVITIMYSSSAAGNTSQFMIDIGAAFNSAQNIFNILDQKDELELQKEEINQAPLTLQKFQSNIIFKNVFFKYPSRCERILNNITFEIKKGQKIALVGSSGSGKSTIIQILLRFYEITSGEILIDGINLKQYDISNLRSIFGVVNQEPILFEGSLEKNITYNTEKVSEQDLINVGKVANIDEFLEKKDDKLMAYQKQIGAKGIQLSGGQKQRVAIARAILKKPQVLLLDEATSALDSKNEALVQEGLDSVQKERTSITVAHRISTIRNSDCIFVIEFGKLVENGTYQNLIEKQGRFVELVKGQEIKQ